MLDSSNIMANAFKEALLKQQAEQQNLTVGGKGDIAYRSSLDACLDVYMSMGALRHNPNEFMELFKRAYNEDSATALALALKLRDIRHGMGERHLGRLALTYCFRRLHTQNDDYSSFFELVKVLGRVDDLFALVETEEDAQRLANYYINEIKQQTDDGPLIAKWLPRKPKTVSAKRVMHLIRKGLKWSHQEMRQWLATTSKTAEQLMSSNRWGEIDYNKLPSRTMLLNRQAFKRQDTTRFAEYLSGLQSGKTKVNASVLYPYEIINSTSLTVEESLLKAQWEGIPDIFQGNATRILPMCDISGSMSIPVTNNATAMDVSASLGYYIASRQPSVFKNIILTFESVPSLFTIDENINIQDVYYTICDSDRVGYDTNFTLAYTKLLEFCLENKLTQEQIPEVILVLSDMNFDSSEKYGDRFALQYGRIKTAFESAGYQMPRLVFWNLHHNGTFQCKDIQEGVCQISGFSQNILKDVLSSINELTPMNTMNKGLAGYRFMVDALFYAGYCLDEYREGSPIRSKMIKNMDIPILVGDKTSQVAKQLLIRKGRVVGLK